MQAHTHTCNSESNSSSTLCRHTPTHAVVKATLHDCDTCKYDCNSQFHLRLVLYTMKKVMLQTNHTEYARGPSITINIKTTNSFSLFSTQNNYKYVYRLLRSSSIMILEASHANSRRHLCSTATQQLTLSCMLLSCAMWVQAGLISGLRLII